MKRILILSCLTLALNGCVNVPDFKQDDLTQIDAIKMNKLSKISPSVVQSDKWWEKLNDKQLNKLIDQAIENNDDMKIAQLNLQKAQTSIKLANDSHNPSIYLDASFSKEQLAPNALTPPPYGGTSINFGQIALSSYYEFDLFDKYSNRIKQQEFLYKSLQLKRDSIILMLSNQVTKLYGSWQYLQQYINSLNKQIALEKSILSMQNKSVMLGKSVKQSTLVEQNILKQLEIIKAQTQQNITSVQNNLQLLLGTFKPEELHFDPKIFTTLKLNIESVQADAVSNRPDIAYYLAIIESQKAYLDSLKADFYPSITLSGDLGLQRINITNTIGLKDWFGSITPAIHLPILDAGLIKGNYIIAGVDVNIFVANYNKAIIQSFYNTDTELHNYNVAKQILNRQSEMYNNQKQDYNFNKVQWSLGRVSKLEWNNYQRNQLQNNLQYITNQYACFNAQLDLINALGGVVDIKAKKEK